MSHFVKIGSRYINLEMVVSFRMMPDGTLRIFFGLASALDMKGEHAEATFNYLLSVIKPADSGITADFQNPMKLEPPQDDSK